MQSATEWRPPTDPKSRNYPYNCWWVAAFSDEVSRELLGRWLLDTPVLLYRREDGTSVAVENRCPHRGAPLSRGCLKGDDVQCGYHGFRFAPDGRCIDVPSMKTPPASARVRSFPLIEQSPYIWIYLGDPEQLDDVPPPPVLEWSDDKDFALIYVLDTGGHTLALKRDERASISRPEIATAKAAGCLGTGFGGREIAKRAQAVPAFITALNGVFPKGILPVPGGVLIRDSGGILLGAAGISGDTSDNDEICAVAMLAVG